MEIAIPLVLLGATYIISESTTPALTPVPAPQKEPFTGNLRGSGPALPNTVTPVNNYPIQSTDPSPAGEMYYSQNYPTPNESTETYLNQTQYQTNERAGNPVGDTIQQVHSLTGNYMNTDEFTHANMVPFTRRRPGGDTSNLNMAESILDNRTGSGSQYTNKVEQAPLFAPTQNMQWAHGAPNASDFLQSRVNPSQRNHMVKPFEQERVGPGLNEKYGTAGSGGFNSGMEHRDSWLPKSVDELRTAINPKDEYSLDGLQGPAASGVQNRGILGKMEKYTPDTFYIQSQDQWLTTTGAEKGPRMAAQEIQHQSHREETSCAEFGPATSTLKTASYAPSNYAPSNRPELPPNQVAHSNATGRAPVEGMDNRHSAFSTSNTKRSECADTSSFGAGFRSAVGAVIAPVMDILNPTRKEDYVCNSRMGNTGVDGTGGYIRSLNNGVDVTTKETTLHQTRGNVGFQTSDGYQTAQYNPIAQNRNTTDTSSFMGAGSARGNIDYSANYNQAPNGAKEATLVGRTNGGNMKMLNHEMNMTLKQDCQPNWYAGANVGTNNGPSIQTYGTHQVVPETREVGVERIQPSILDAFNSNPYTFNLNQVA